MMTVGRRAVLSVRLFGPARKLRLGLLGKGFSSRKSLMLLISVMFEKSLAMVSPKRRLGDLGR